MGIDELKTKDWRDQNLIPDTDGIDARGLEASGSKVKFSSSRSHTKVG